MTADSLNIVCLFDSGSGKQTTHLDAQFFDLQSLQGNDGEIQVYANPHKRIYYLRLVKTKNDLQ